MRNRFSYLCNHHFPSYTLSVFHSEVFFFTIIFHRFHCCLCSCPARMINGLWTLTPRLPLAILLRCPKLSASISGQQQKKKNSLRMANCLASKERKFPICVWYRVKWKDCTRTLSFSTARCRLSEIFFVRSQNRAMNNNKWESSSERPSFSVELAFLSCPIAECVYVFTQVRLPEIINYREKLLIMVIFLDINSLAHIQSSTNLLIWVFMRRRINVYVRFVDYVWWNSREGLSRCSKETTQLWTSLR